MILVVAAVAAVAAVAVAAGWSWSQVTSASFKRPWLAAAEISVVKVTTLGSTRAPRASEADDFLVTGFKKHDIITSFSLL